MVTEADAEDRLVAAWDAYNDALVDWADLNRPLALRDYDRLQDARRAVERAAIEEATQRYCGNDWLGADLKEYICSPAHGRCPDCKAGKSAKAK